MRILRSKQTAKAIIVCAMIATFMYNAARVVLPPRSSSNVWIDSPANCEPAPRDFAATSRRPTAVTLSSVVGAAEEALASAPARFGK